MTPSIQLVPMGTLTIQIDQRTRDGATPAGVRIVGEVLDCEWPSGRVAARALGKMSHAWLMETADGSVSVDARLLLMTDDGALIGVSYRGKDDRQPRDGGVI